MKITMSRVFALLLAVLMTISILPMQAIALELNPDETSGYVSDSLDGETDKYAAVPLGDANANSASETGKTVYVLAGSDFQARGGHAAGADIVSGILNQIRLDYPTMNGFLFMGDYDVNYSDSVGGKTKLQQTVQNVYGTGMNEVYVQGNHDGDALVGSTLSNSGNNDTDDYGVFVINEKDYMWYNDDEATIKKTANNLKAYLNAKRNTGYTKPIFVVSHLPLHYSMRTREGGGDGKYANYIFDVLNEAGNAGLNIIFMFGHDHSHGWDDYLGGAAIYLAKGDKINIAQSSKTVFKEETLAFTYMNAGYVGYYGDSYGGTADKTLTMTVFAITGDSVTVSRYASNGTHDLKSAGVYNVEYPDSAYYKTDATVYTSPQTITLNTDIKPVDEEIEAPGSGSGDTPRTYTRVTSTSELKSEGKYLLIYNGEQFMLPKSVSKSNTSGTRIGFDVESTSVCGPDTITGDYQAKEWVLTSGKNGGWLLGNGSQYAKLTSTDNTEITATFEATGSEFTIGGTANAFTFQSGSYYLNHNSRGLINGYASKPAKFYIYRMTNEGSSSSVTTSGGDWVTITEPTAGGTRYVYELDTDGIDNNGVYLIVANGYDKAMTAAANSDNSMAVEINGNLAYMTSDAYDWTFVRYSDGVYYIRFNGGNYLRNKDGSLTSNSKTDKDRRWTATSNGNGSYEITNDGYHLRWSQTNTRFQLRTDYNGPVRLYKFLREETVAASEGLYLKTSGELTYNVPVGTSAEAALAKVKEEITVYGTSDKNAEGTAYNDDDITWTLDPNYSGAVPGEYAVTISYRGKTVGVAKVVVPSVDIVGYSIDKTHGSVYKGSSQGASTGSSIMVTLADGKYYSVPVTVSMLSHADGSKVSTGATGKFTGLTVTYNNVVIASNYTLDVIMKSGNNYPEYPNAGAIKVNKTATGQDFQSSGIAMVELSASGIPTDKGADVIVMLDTSSSMNTIVGDSAKSRIQILRESLSAMLTQMKTTGENGQQPDIRIAVADFNFYYGDTSSHYYLDSNDHPAGTTIRDPSSGKANNIYTGSGSLNADAFVDVKTLATNAFDIIETGSGTNYDYAFDAVYQLGQAIGVKNAKAGEDRDLYVIFMSDGAPFQFNYFSSQSEGNGAAYWNNWLQHTFTDDMYAENANRTYYNNEGKHWMAEAIKGSPENTYPVIRKNMEGHPDNWIQVSGLGATIYSIGFCLQDDKEITVASMEHVLENIASEKDGTTTYYNVNSAAGLTGAFTSIGQDIAYAATNARFEDKMGENFNLQMKTATYTVLVDGAPVKKTLAPVIEVVSYKIYSRQDYENGTITQDKIGTRTGEKTLLEVVKFSDDGKKAYSNLIDVDGDGVFGVTINADGTYTIGDPDDNILNENGVIYARSFLYNNHKLPVVANSIEIGSEQFYWNLGTVKAEELAMRYYVYLEGSMEGTRAAGSYPTNEFAVLYYDNYLGVPCQKETVSPVMAWKSANVSYAFYLVNDSGEIIVNQTTGRTGSFANKIAVTNPVVYEEILLNSDTEVSSLNVKAISENVLPKYYDLYDEAAVYTVQINSNSTGHWDIEMGDGLVQTTYVTQFGGNPDFSNVLHNESVDTDYTHTIVWFAVKWSIQAHPDAVVVDFGLPVDISVLSNDMFGDYGKLAGVGAYTEGIEDTAAGAALEEGFGNSFVGKFGDAVADTAKGLVRYTLNTMEINGYDKFAYAVNYTGSENAGYYYDTITVIPATNIYYEDDFLTYEGHNTKWEIEGTEFEGATQDEDRPGEYSITDANNIYGYDSVNLDMSTFSLGSARKVRVDANSYAKARFSFYGTGFDVISMTSGSTGTISVKVTAENGKVVKSVFVDTFYGYKIEYYSVTYTYTDGKWVETVIEKLEGKPTEAKAVLPDTANEGDTVTTWKSKAVVNPDSKDAVYQVPVIKIEGLPYGKYDVVITASYTSVFDHKESGSYYLYLDAIRIYDPANNGLSDGTEDTTIEDAYRADGEGWPSYIELRNQIIDAGKFGASIGSKTIEGLVFIDGNPEVNNATISDYISFGPNNEVYLAPGQSIAFQLSAPENIKNVHIGIKCASGAAATYSIVNVASADSADVKIKAGDYFNSKSYPLNTSTDMYYDLTNWVNGNIIVITNTGNLNGTEGIVSITNIKTTYKSDPKAPAEAANFSNFAAQAETEEVEARETAFVYMTYRAANLAVEAINTMNKEEVKEPESGENTNPGTGEGNKPGSGNNNGSSGIVIDLDKDKIDIKPIENQGSVPASGTSNTSGSGNSSNEESNTETEENEQTGEEEASETKENEEEAPSEEETDDSTESTEVIVAEKKSIWESIVDFFIGIFNAITGFFTKLFG